MNETFQFANTEHLKNDEIYLGLVGTMPLDEAKGYVPCYAFTICLCSNNAQVGEINLRIGYNQNIYYGGNIGYKVFPQYRGNHYALKACTLIIQLARQHNMKTLLLTCDPDNFPSRRTCELLGAKLLQILALPPENEMVHEGHLQKCQYEIVI
jgi:predicted acetyltransferase